MAEPPRPWKPAMPSSPSAVEDRVPSRPYRPGDHSNDPTRLPPSSTLQPPADRVVCCSAEPGPILSRKIWQHAFLRLYRIVQTVMAPGAPRSGHADRLQPPPSEPPAVFRAQC